MTITKCLFTSIAVADLEAAIASYQAMFDLRLVTRGSNPAMRADFAYLSLGNAYLALLCPQPGNERLSQHLEPFGDRAYALGLEVDDMDATLAHLASLGVEPFQRFTLGDGTRIEWIGAEHTHGIIVQLRQAPPGDVSVPPNPPDSSGLVERLSLHCIIVRDLDAATETWKRLFGLEVAAFSEGEELGNKNNILPLGSGGAFLEIMTPRTGSEPWARLLDERGETTFLVGFDVADMDAVVARVRGTGRRVVGEHTSADGSKMAMVHPLDAHGVMVELLQH